MTGSLYDYNDVVLRIDSGAPKHITLDVNLFTLCDPEVKNLTFNTDAGTTITSRAVGTVSYKAYDTNHEQRVVTLCGAYYVTHQPHDIVAVGQLTRNSQAQCESPDFKNCVWQNNFGINFAVERVNQGFVWKNSLLSPQGEKTVDGVVVQQSLAVTRSQAR